eukprot:GHVR01042497.1.p1 GENE.GHVR01042497.1~~GHVR01042497.1.p1  ORF type:complete len:130 (-),score=75.69 GHVR01042497.1:163-552(-)
MFGFLILDTTTSEGEPFLEYSWISSDFPVSEYSLCSCKGIFLASISVSKNILGQYLNNIIIYISNYNINNNNNNNIYRIICNIRRVDNWALVTALYSPENIYTHTHTHTHTQPKYTHTHTHTHTTKIYI